MSLESTLPAAKVDGQLPALGQDSRRSVRASDWNALRAELIAASNDVVNVRHFGAVGDGVADDTAAFNSAIDAANAAAASFPGGFTILVPKGSFKLPGSLHSITGFGIRIVGMGATILAQAGTLFTWEQGTLATVQGSVEDLTISYGTPTSGACIVKMLKATDVRLSNLRVYGAWTILSAGDAGSVAYNPHVENLSGHVYNGGQPAFVLGTGGGALFSNVSLYVVGVPPPAIATTSSLTRAGTTVTVTTTGNHGFTAGDTIRLYVGTANFPKGAFTVGVPNATQFTYTQAGTATTDNVALTVSQNAMLTAGGNNFLNVIGNWDTVHISNLLAERFSYGLNIAPASGTAQNFFVQNATFDYCRLSCVLLNSTNGLVLSTQFSNSWFSSWETDGVTFSGTNSNRDHQFSNNRFVFAGTHGILIGNANHRDVVLKGNVFRGTNRLDLGANAITVNAGQGFVIEGNAGVDTSYLGTPFIPVYGIAIADAVDNIVLKGNSVYGSTGYLSFNQAASATIGRLARDNIQANVARSGVTGAIATGATVSHGLRGTPTSVVLTAADGTPTAVFPSALGATTFTVNYTGGGTHVFYWHAEM